MDKGMFLGYRDTDYIAQLTGGDQDCCPEVNPTTTEWETKFTSAPRRAIPEQLKNPARKVRVSTILTYSGLKGAASGLIVVKITIDIAVVGPEIRWYEEPKRAAMMQVLSLNKDRIQAADLRL